MPARRLLLAVLVAIGLLIAPAAATAKERLVAVHVCGVDRCVALPSQAFGPASAILARRFFRRPARPLPFYDVLFVWRTVGGGFAAYDPLRWVPRVGATRTDGARGPVWSRTSVALTAALSAAVTGVRPRPGRALNDPMDVVGPATAAVRQRVNRP